MKKILLFLIIAILASVLLIITKPSDQQCISEIKDKIDAQVTRDEGNGVIASFTKYLADIGIDNYNQYLFKIEDRTFYKDIYLTGSTDRIGFAVLGLVIFTNKPAIDTYLQSQQQKPSVAKQILDNAALGIKKDEQKVKQFFEGKPKPVQQVPTGNSLQDQLQQINAQITTDQEALNKAKEFHFGRMPSKKECDINEANAKLLNDEQRKQQIESEISK